MTPQSLFFQAKAHRVGEVLEFHPLLGHCADVAACLEALLERPVIRDRLEHAAGGVRLTEVHRHRLCVLAALHDAGKVNHGFQRRIRGEGRGAGHVGPLLALLDDTVPRNRPLRRAVIAALGLPAMADWCDPPEGVDAYLRAILAHHGAPAQGESADAALWSAAGGRDPVQGIAGLAAAARAWFPQAFELGEPLPAAEPFVHAFCGLLMLADWLGSDAAFFPYAAPGDGDRIAFARERARHALAAIGLDTDAARRRLGDRLPSFQALFGVEPRPAQRAVEALDGADDGGLAILEAETGSGKTEAALRRFLELFRQGAVDGLYFALPTRTAAVQIHARVHDAVARILGADAPPVVLAVPGYMRVDDGTAEGRLPGFGVLWPDGGPGADGRGWAAEHPKRYCAAPIAVGTIDQVLLAALQVKHAHLRGAAVLRQFVVVDEVHASDPYMATLLGVLLDLLRAAGGHALLLSATLGAAARTRLLGRPASATPPLAEAVAVPYPLLATRAGDGPPIAAGGTAKRITIRLADAAAEADSIAAEALAAARRGARVLVIRNTVRGALAVQLALEGCGGGRCRPASRLRGRAGGPPFPLRPRGSAAARRRAGGALRQGGKTRRRRGGDDADG
ncbi:CRISPR-associated endonuclease Cas3'' [Azospirillum sp.]|uniref:CRISPR-associated endonuclease Cas3'' n=1 Tax=Azospirillum sp. TaxID=34012 RepID=UPI002D53AAB5|nr:CRISPR-associated endonuclease Cas3'' [Azospirillum sp.]HYD68491.1 CRISPR-associated endonuclease Cas3'' [Azospirillum sp.]